MLHEIRMLTKLNSCWNSHRILAVIAIVGPLTAIVIIRRVSGSRASFYGMLLSHARSGACSCLYWSNRIRSIIRSQKKIHQVTEQVLLTCRDFKASRKESE